MDNCTSKDLHQDAAIELRAGGVIVRNKEPKDKNTMDIVADCLPEEGVKRIKECPNRDACVSRRVRVRVSRVIV